MGIAMPAMTEPTITIIVVAQAAGVLPWLLMLDILAPFNVHTLILRALLQSLSRNLTRNFTAPNPQLGLHLYQARAMDLLPAHIEMAIPHAWLPGGQTTGEVLALRPSSARQVRALPTTPQEVRRDFAMQREGQSAQEVRAPGFFAFALEGLTQ